MTCLCRCISAPAAASIHGTQRMQAMGGGMDQPQNVCQPMLASPGQAGGTPHLDGGGQPREQLRNEGLALPNLQASGCVVSMLLQSTAAGSSQHLSRQAPKGRPLASSKHAHQLSALPCPPRAAAKLACMITNLRLHLDTILRKVSQAMSCTGGMGGVAGVTEVG